MSKPNFSRHISTSFHSTRRCGSCGTTYSKTGRWGMSSWCWIFASSQSDLKSLLKAEQRRNFKDLEMASSSTAGQKTSGRGVSSVSAVVVAASEAAVRRRWMKAERRCRRGRKRWLCRATSLHPTRALPRRYRPCSAHC